MFNESSFQAASEAAERSVGLLAETHANRGNWALAYGYLSDMHSERQRYHAVLYAVQDELACVSDGVVECQTLFGPQAYASAHEAIEGICFFAYLGLMRPLENDIKDEGEWKSLAHKLLDKHGEALSINASLMRALIRRERAKLLAQLKEASSETSGNVPPAVVPEDPLLKKLLKVLAPKQRQIVKHLWNLDSDTITFDEFKNIPNAWQGNTTSEDAIVKKAYKINERLVKANLTPALSIEVSRAEECVNFNLDKTYRVGIKTL